MAPEKTRGPNLRELEALRISRSDEPPHPTRWRTPVIMALVLIGLAAAAYQVYLHTLGKPLEVQTAAAALLQTEQPHALLSGSGYVVTRDKYITIGTKILGQIIAEPIEEGKHVRKGDLLARIDDRDYQAQLKQALADRDLAQANLKLAQAKAVRQRELFRQSVISQDELDVAENALAVAQANLEHANAEIAYARFNVSQCVIRSPINGVVLQKYREIGDTINYGGDIQAGGGTTDIVQLADTGDMRVEADISENDIAKVRLGMPASIVLDAYPQRTFKATVVKIYPEADRQKGTVKVEAKFLQPDMAIVRPEMSAKLTFLARAQSSARPVLLVPKNAIVKLGGSSYVWTLADGRALRVAITPGREFENGTEITSGLADGEAVIIAPPDGLRNGLRVIPKAS